MHTRQGSDRLQDVPVERLAAASPVPDLASQLGNRAFGVLMRDTPVAEAPKPAAADPAADAKKLVAEAPATDVDLAAWLVKAADLGFATVWTATRKDLDALKDGNKASDGVEPSKTEITIHGLETMHAVVKGPMSRWADAPAGAKQPVALGSFMRDKSGLHAGPAIDLPRGMGAGTDDAVITMLGDLTPGNTYGIGLPFSGDYFDPADEMETKKKAAEDAAKDGTPATVTGALTLDTTNVFKVEWDAEKKAWKKPEVESAGAAFTRLKSQKLRDQFKAMRKAGTSLIIFPDRPGHVHIDQR